MLLKQQSKAQGLLSRDYSRLFTIMQECNGDYKELYFFIMGMRIMQFKTTGCALLCFGMQSSASRLLYHEGSLRRRTREVVGSIPEISRVVNAGCLVVMVPGHVITLCWRTLFQALVCTLCKMAQEFPAQQSWRVLECGEIGDIWQNGSKYFVTLLPHLLFNFLFFLLTFCIRRSVPNWL